MKTSALFFRSTRRGFTLIELLVVVVIIALIAGLSIPVINAAMERAQRTQTQAVMQQMRSAIQQFRTDFNRFPVDLPATAAEADVEDLLTDGSNGLIAALMALEPTGGATLNRTQTRYLDLPAARNGRFGVTDPAAGGAGAGEAAFASLTDLWGRPYRVLLDTNYDNRINNPDVQSNDVIISSRAPNYLSSPVLIYSVGQDGVAQTKDDIVSWR